MSLDWKTLPSLSALRAFDAVARHGGFAGAARALNVTHAAVSQQVRGLERDLDLALAQRAGRGIALTEAGETLARALSDGFGGIARCLADLQAETAGRALRVSTTPYIVDSLILPRLSEFWAAHPGVEVALQPAAENVDLLAEGFDLAIRAAPRRSSWPGLDAIELGPSRLVIVGHPDLVGDETDSRKLPWVWSDRMEDKIAALEHAGVDVGGLKRVEVGSVGLSLAAIRRGLGLGMASSYVARDDLEAGRLVALDLPGLPNNIWYFAVTPKGARRKVVGDFTAWLQEIFREGS
ncbi:MAG: LysR substrate-binding domain-containing protein [Silicimonas sp.]|nr:LysR substrate-binding domain-containing protein [Silicimonas sp.]